MDINPKCDVETFPDFQKYYQKAYLPTRNGTVVYYQSTIDSTAEVVLIRESKKHGEDNPYNAVHWKALRDTLIFSRINGKLGVINGKVYLAMMFRNKTTLRGFRPENYSWWGQGIKGGLGPCDSPHQYHTGMVYDQFLTTKPYRLWHCNPFEGQGVLIDDKYFLGNAGEGGNKDLFLLDQRIGEFSYEHGITLLDAWKFLVPVLLLKPVFKGVSIQ